jgi:lipid-A-disaccharide synthase
MYAAWFLEKLKERVPALEAFGSAGPRLREAGCEPLLRSESIAMVGLLEVLFHVPRVWREYRRLTANALERRPDLAVLVDAPDFNLRLARQFHKAGIPVLYLVAPQAWAWRPWRAAQIRKNVTQLLCIFPPD